ncbi:MAG: hypothetical protein AAF702_31855 [Chloroflexota bacterium]
MSKWLVTIILSLGIFDILYFGLASYSEFTLWNLWGVALIIVFFIWMLWMLFRPAPGFFSRWALIGGLVWAIWDLPELVQRYRRTVAGESAPLIFQPDDALLPSLFPWENVVMFFLGNMMIGFFYGALAWLLCAPIIRHYAKKGAAETSSATPTDLDLP